MKKISKFFESIIQLQIEGLNFERFLGYLKQNHITVNNVKRIEHTKLVFDMNYANYKLALKNKVFRNHKVTTLKKYGIHFMLKNYKAYIGALVGVFVFTAIFGVLSSFTFNINILGTSSINNNDIVNVLKQHNIKIGQINLVNNKDIELLLKQEFDDISLVSVIKRGTNLVINIKEKEKVNDEEYSPIIAPANVVITHLEVFQGTTSLSVGDIVKQGQVLVEPFIVNDKGEKVPTKPLAKIQGHAWYFGRVEFETKEIKKEKTGKVATTSHFILFGQKIWPTQQTHSFENFIVEEKLIKTFNNFFIPVQFESVKIYEVNLVEVEHNFEENKEELINQSKQLANSVVPKNKEVLEEVLTISNIGTKIIVQTALKTNIEILVTE